MNIRSQGVPLKSRFIREDADRFHPRSDGADFRVEYQHGHDISRGIPCDVCHKEKEALPMSWLPDDFDCAPDEEQEAYFDVLAGKKPKLSADDDSPIDDEQWEADQELMSGCPSQEGWEHAHKLAKELDETRQYYEKHLDIRQECIEYWQGEVKRLEAELAESKREVEQGNKDIAMLLDRLDEIKGVKK